VAVYTNLTADDLAGLIAEYDVGELVSAKGIAEGVSNSNWLVETTAGRFILTMYEHRVDESDLPFFLSLLDHLSARGSPVPRTIHDRAGAPYRTIRGKAVALIEFLPGVSIDTPRPAQARAVGEALAGIHLAAADFPGERENSMGLAAWRDLLADCGERLGEIDSALPGLVARELDFLDAGWPRDLPRSVIHADLFPDNVLMLGNRVSGLIDFYFACTDMLAYDLSICLNAWCFEPDGAFNVTKARALLASYRAERALSPAELAALPLLARGNALRFLLTRLYDWLNHPPGAFVRPKDPLEYWRKLRFHQHVAGVAAYGIDP